MKSVRAAHWVKHAHEHTYCYTCTDTHRGWKLQATIIDNGHKDLQEEQRLLVVQEEKTIQECELLREERAFQHE